jgi:hypothetical protein
MTAADLPAVHDLSARSHPDFPERPEVIAEKLRLFPRGCLVLDATDSVPCGYCFSHPWTIGPPPALNVLLGALPERPDAYFIHDLTVEVFLRRKHLASVLVPQLIEIAREISIARMTLVAVSGSTPFWMHMGFRETADEALQAAARVKYGAGAVAMERDSG